jgi:hypothetical protein
LRGRSTDAYHRPALFSQSICRSTTDAPGYSGYNNRFFIVSLQMDNSGRLLQPAAYANCLSGDPGGLIRGEKDSYTRDIFRLSQAAERCRGNKLHPN